MNDLLTHLTHGQMNIRFTGETKRYAFNKAMTCPCLFLLFIGTSWGDSRDKELLQMVH
jgi:hypothetical protein